MELSPVLDGFEATRHNSDDESEVYTKGSHSIEFRYNPLRIFKAQVERYGPACLTLLGVYTAVMQAWSAGMFSGETQTLADGFYRDLFWGWAILLPFVGMLVAFLCNRLYSRLAGPLLFDTAGIRLDRGAALCPWASLLCVVPEFNQAKRIERLRFTFDCSGWGNRTKRYSRGWGDSRDGRQDIVFDLAAIAEKDHKRLLSAIARFAPENKVHEELRTNRLQNSSFTQLWLDSFDGSPNRSSLSRLEAGAFVDDNRYEIVRIIASGGQATAYAAIDHRANVLRGEPSNVVLKEFVVPVHGGEQGVQEMIFEVELISDLMKKISGDQIVKLYRSFCEDYRVYLVFEHLEGASLREIVLQGTRFSNAQVLDLAQQMCRMLIHLHEQDPPVLHRDFAPDNLILSPEGKLKLIDFDVALPGLSNSGAKVVGKPGYMAPEQFRGQPVTQSDVYSLAACLYFVATGKDPVPISVSRPCDVRPDFDTDLDAIVQRCTDPEPSARYSARELALQLDRIRE